VNFAAVERAEKLCTSSQLGQVDLAQGLCAYLEENRLVITKTGGSEVKEDWPQIEHQKILALSVPGCVDLLSGWRLISQWVDSAAFPDFAHHPQERAWEAWLDADSLPEVLALRSMQPGDRIRPLGMSGRSQKLSDFWINQKLPRRARSGWPLLTSAENILWIPGFRVADPYRIRKDSRRALYLHLLREETSGY
jgi:tRNA(Ile)-lysidine synthase